MILRFRSKDGMFRVNVDPSTTFKDALVALQPQLPPSAGSITVSRSPTEIGEPLSKEWTQPINNLGIQNGDLFYIRYVLAADEPAEPAVSTEEVSTENDKLDLYLSTKDARIHRDQTHLCSHGAKGMCEYCQPLEPWDEAYHLEHGIKHLSVHAYRRKLLEEGASLEPQSYTGSACRNPHKPWPEGYCSACQPSAVTLQFQKFRMVDHVEFQSPKIIDQFIEYWRMTSKQRVGFLVGRYSEYANVPLGIKAEVHAIYEPEQINDVDSLMMSLEPSSKVVRACKLLGMEIIGLVFTDLVDDGGEVVCKRHPNSYFLTSLEVLLATKLQNTFKHSVLGQDFSSRFVTCCVSGNEKGEVSVSCYQASIQAEALAKADFIVPCTNPSVMKIKPVEKHQYIPDIFYKRVNEYKLTILENALPAFPVDYLLVSLSHGFKAAEEVEVELPTFAIENRVELRKQTHSQLYDVLGLAHGFDALALLNFHVLLYLLNLDILSASEEELVHNLINATASNLETKNDLLVQFIQAPALETLRQLVA